MQEKSAKIEHEIGGFLNNFQDPRQLAEQLLEF
jgi:hypothetical protein